MTTTPACGACRFYTPLPAAVVGKCNRFPQSVPKGVGEWCGEFSAAEPVKVKVGGGTATVAPPPAKKAATKRRK